MTDKNLTDDQLDDFYRRVWQAEHETDGPVATTQFCPVGCLTAPEVVAGSRTGWRPEQERHLFTARCPRCLRLLRKLAPDRAPAGDAGPFVADRVLTSMPIGGSVPLSFHDVEGVRATLARDAGGYRLEIVWDERPTGAAVQVRVESGDRDAWSTVAELRDGSSSGAVATVTLSEGSMPGEASGSPRVLAIELVPARAESHPLTPSPPTAEPAPARHGTNPWRGRRLVAIGAAAVAAAVLVGVLANWLNKPNEGANAPKEGNSKGVELPAVVKLTGEPLREGTLGGGTEGKYKQRADGAYEIDTPTLDLTFACERTGYYAVVIFREGEDMSPPRPTAPPLTQAGGAFNRPLVTAPGPNERAAVFAVVTPEPAAAWVAEARTRRVPAERFAAWVEERRRELALPWAAVVRIDLVGTPPKE